MTSFKWLPYRRGATVVGIAALLVCGVGVSAVLGSTPAPKPVASHVVYYGCLATHGHREVFDVFTNRAHAHAHPCPNGSVRVSWNAQGSKGSVGPAGAMGATGAKGATGAPGASGAPGSPGTAGTAGAAGPTGAPGSSGANGTNGTDGATGPTGSAGPRGPSGPGGMVSGGVFTLQSDSSFPDTNAYLPLSGYLGTEVKAPPLDQDAEVVEAQHTSVEQVIARDQTITGIFANFGSTTDLAGHVLHVQLTLLASSGGTALLTPRTGCFFDVNGNGPTSNSCSLPGDQAVGLNAGDVAVVYLHAYVTGWEPNSPISVYGTVALSS